jgi:translation initiation factor 3 subunit J
MQSQAQYPYFVETLTRELCSSMSLDDTRKISTVISAQINEKQKAFSNKKKKGGAVKKAQLAKASTVETENYEIYEGEYDDFM